jgi:hypothetical protein
MGDTKRILQPVASAKGKKAKAADLIRERMRSLRGVLQKFPKCKKAWQTSQALGVLQIRYLAESLSGGGRLRLEVSD